MRKSTHTFEYKSLRQQLASLRAAAGLSQRQLATILRVPHSWVAKVESGERRIDMVEFVWFCDACGTSPGSEAAQFFSKIPNPGRSGSRRGGGQ
ncbi:MAG: helix-turn-helix transcriptional regulator [Tepidisphaeraceae bacterium]|jgi:transcriptional regulator with XRE-family HTH domain